MPKTKSKKQVAFLLSKGSPLSEDQEEKLKRELHSGEVRVGKGKKSKEDKKSKGRKKKGKGKSKSTFSPHW